MNRKLPILIAALLFAASSIASATVIVNATTTSDTGQGLEFLHVNQTSGMTAAAAQAGISYGGFSWVLATAGEFVTLIENVTGVMQPIWNGGTASISNLWDVDFNQSQADDMMAALGEGLNSSLPGFWVDGEGFGISQVYAHTSCCDDYHLSLGGQWGSTVPGLFVRGAAVPEPATLALIGLGLAGIGYRRRRLAAGQ